MISLIHLSGECSYSYTGYRAEVYQTLYYEPDGISLTYDCAGYSYAHFAEINMLETSLPAFFGI